VLVDVDREQRHGGAPDSPLPLGDDAADNRAVCLVEPLRERLIRTDARGGGACES
jgi:hypothetical protein